MPLDRFVLILVAVIAGAGLTIWLATLAMAALRWPLGWAVFIPLALLAYIGWRVLIERLGNRDDDHYDRIEK